MKQAILKITNLSILALIIFAAHSIAFSQNVQTVPLYRLRYNHYETGGFFSSETSETKHFYTTNKAERDSAIANLSKDTHEGFANFGYVQFYDQGNTGYVSPKQLPGTVAFYRLYHAGPKHFYTTKMDEMNMAISKLGYKSEGIVGYISPTQTPGTTPLFRVHRPTKGSGKDDHFYTTDENEKWKAVHALGYQDEGIAGYVWTSAVELTPTGKVFDTERVKTINGVYIKAMGRMANQDDINYWLPRTEDFAQMLTASRNFLYSKAGAKELVATQLRVLKTKLKREPTDSEGWGVLAYFERLKAKRMIYDEMLKQAQSEKGELK